jgi:5-methylcytosine-specific restriction endonuclease McrA
MCKACGIEKPLSEFHRNSHNNDGYNGKCKSCRKIQSIGYYKTHAKSSNASTKRYRDSHPEKVKQMADDYKKNHPEKVRAMYALKNHRKKGYKTTVTTAFVESLFINTTHCSLCGRELFSEYGSGLTKASKSLDRINNETELREDNIWIICYDCNSIKRDKTLVEFIEYCKNIVRRHDGET